MFRTEAPDPDALLKAAWRLTPHCEDCADPFLRYRVHKHNVEIAETMAQIREVRSDGDPIPATQRDVRIVREYIRESVRRLNERKSRDLTARAGMAKLIRP